MVVSYRLGCPVWASERWVGSLYTRSAKRDDFLPQYSRVFQTVEVNSTFYGLPPLATAARWAASVEPGFRFAVKFPRAISHERRLRDAGPETAAFLDVLDVLAAGGCLGPAFLQLPPNFGGDELEALAAYLESLPERFRYAVEVRQRDYFDEGETEGRLDALLAGRDVDRVLMDTRPLFSAPPSDEAEERTQRRKPRGPVRRTVTGRHPLLRLIGRNDIAAVQPWIDEWAATVGGWIGTGLEPFVFTHTPDDIHAPPLARAFHEALRRHVPDLPPLPPFPGEAVEDAPRQLRLF
jgi:uncharacterized protein YecE (DUF72 family)